MGQKRGPRSSIIIETDDGHSIQWSRKSNSPRYTIDGQPFDRLERGGVPAILHDVLRLPKVLAEGDREFDVHFGEQKSPVFLVDKPGSYAAQFFASSSDAARLVEMQKRHQQKTVDARRERIRLEAQAEKLAADLTVLAVTDQVQVDVTHLEMQHKELCGFSSKIERLDQDTIALKLATESGELYQSELAILEMLTFPPALPDPQPLAGTVAILTATEREFAGQSMRATYLSTLEASPDLRDERPVVELIQDLLSTQTTCRRLYDECAVVLELVSPPALVACEPLQIIITQIGSVDRQIEISAQILKALQLLHVAPRFDDEVTLSQDIGALTQATRLLRRAHTIHECLNVLPSVLELPDTRETERMIGELLAVTATFNSQTQTLAETEELLEVTKRQLCAWAEQQQVCPTCGQLLDQTQIILHAESHTEVHHHD